MPDIVTYTSDLKIVAGFVDGDTRTISMPGPRADITKADIQGLDSLMAGVLIGDKYGSDFAAVSSAYYHKATKTVIDLTEK